MKTLKCEEVHRQEYRTLPEARECIVQFIDQVNNRRRLHSALGYRLRAEFERMSAGDGDGEVPA